MSLATNIKEFADILHNISAQQLSSITSTDIPSDTGLPLAIPKIVVIGQACIYFVKSIGSEIISFLSFQWLRDVSYYPLLIPESQDRSSIVTDTFLSEPGSYLFPFSKDGVSLFSSTLQGDKNWNIKDSLLFNSFLKGDLLLAGFVNSFFFSLPFSLPHLITLRRMFCQGVPAAAASVFGTVAAHSFVLIGVIYEIRFLIIPFYSLEPLIFLIGTITAAIVITEFVKDKRVYPVPLTHYPSLLRIGVLNFILALCQSATVFNDLHNLTLNKQISYLELHKSSDPNLPLFSLPFGATLGVPPTGLWHGILRAFDLFFSNTAYLLAFVFGQILFSFLFYYLILKANQKLCVLTGYSPSQTARKIKKPLLLAIVTFTLSGFPYYGLDYLFTKGAGFLPEDPAYINTIFSPTLVKSRNPHLKSEDLDEDFDIKNEKTPFSVDLNYFDRGIYFNPTEQEKITTDPFDDEDPSKKKKEEESSESLESARQKPKKGVIPKISKKIRKKIGSIDEITETDDEITETFDPSLTFEELNYQGESAWFMRHDRTRNIPEEDLLKEDSTFQKEKIHFNELRLKQDTKQASEALKETSQIGSISGLKEGSRFGEELPFYSEDSTEGSTEGERNKRISPILKRISLILQGGKKALPHSEESASGRPKLSVPSTGKPGETDTIPEQNLDEEAIFKELEFENEVEAIYDQSFASPFKEESDEIPLDLIAMENLVKKRYRLNPVYRALLKTDIDSFMARQPVDYKITPNQEANLFKKRQLLEKYYNSIRYYAPTESINFRNLYASRFEDSNVESSTDRLGEPSLQFPEQIDESVNFLNNEAFEDSNVESSTDRLGEPSLQFPEQIDKSVNFLNNEAFEPDTSKRSIPFTKSFIETTYHQQFKGTLNTIKKFFKLTFDEEQNSDTTRILSYDQPLYKNSTSYLEAGKDYHPSLHEELELGTSKVSPFLEESNSAPIYAGWDDKERRFVITNRFNFVIARETAAKKQTKKERPLIIRNQFHEAPARMAVAEQQTLQEQEEPDEF